MEDLLRLQEIKSLISVKVKERQDRILHDLIARHFDGTLTALDARNAIASLAELHQLIIDLDTEIKRKQGVYKNLFSLDKV